MEDSPEQEDPSTFVVIVRGSVNRLIQNSSDYHIEYLLAVPPLQLQPFLDDRRAAGNVCLVSPDVSVAMNTAIHTVKKEEPTNERIPSSPPTHRNHSQMTSEDELEELLNCEQELTSADEREFPDYIWPTKHQGGSKHRNAKGKGKQRSISKAPSEQSKGNRARDTSVSGPIRSSRRRQQRYNPVQASQGCRRSKRLEAPQPLRRSARFTQIATQPVASSSRRQLTPPSLPVASSSHRQLTPPRRTKSPSRTSSLSSGSPSSSSSSSQSSSPMPPCPFDFDDYKEAVNILMGPRRPTSPVFESDVREEREQSRRNDAVQVLERYKNMWVDYFAAEGITII